MTTPKRFTPQVYAPLEGWDETTDAIIYIIETTPDYHLSLPELTLDKHPERSYNRSYYEPLEDQIADLIGWPISHGEKQRFKFHSEPVAVVNAEGEEVEGYEVTVDKVDYKYPVRYSPHNTFLVVGRDRRDFRLAQPNEHKLEVKKL